MSAVLWVWQFPAFCTNVVDGDTIDVQIDAGFHATRTERLRLLGVNTPELHDADPIKRGAANDAKVFTTQTLLDWSVQDIVKYTLVIETSKSDAFGRYLARVWRRTEAGVVGADLSSLIIAAGHGVPFMVGK